MLSSRKPNAFQDLETALLALRERQTAETAARALLDVQRALEALQDRRLVAVTD